MENKQFVNGQNINNIITILLFLFFLFLKDTALNFTETWPEATLCMFGWFSNMSYHIHYVEMIPNILYVSLVGAISYFHYKTGKSFE